MAPIEIGLRLAGALSRFWFIRGYFGEGRGALAAVLSAEYKMPSTEYRVPSTEWSEDTGYSVLGTRYSALLRAKALQAAGDLSRAQGDYISARPLCEESLAIYRELGGKKDMAVALIRLAIVTFDQGENPLARSLAEESLTISRELGDKNDIGMALGLLGLVAFMEGDYLTARAMLEEDIALYRELRDRFNLAIRLNNLGNVALMQGDYAEARSLHEEALTLRRELGDKWGIAVCLVGLGGAAVLAGDPEKGTRVLAAADALLAALGVSLEADDRPPYERGVASARTRLDEETFARAWAEGQALSMEQAIQEGLGVSVRLRSLTPTPSPLTPIKE